MFLEVTYNLTASEILRSMVRNHSLKKAMVLFMDWKNQYSENEYTTQSNL